MKKLIIILFVLSLTACKKDVANPYPPQATVKIRGY